ncbi:MAG: glutamine amidotransferase [Gammaproteobacteria bacterium]|nr:glutamine amidotransferase [Gammaproteobacteria bacterium]MDO9319644.1 glutamine amidotransferase [Gammaproteobacteria bacterium]
MTGPLLIMKTGQTLTSLRATGEDFEHWIVRAMGLPASLTSTVAVHEDEALPPLADIAGIVVTGSPAMLTDGAPWNAVAVAYLREAVRGALPVLGICYGHQLLAHAFGGRVDYHPAGREIGTVPLRLHGAAHGDPLLAGVPADFVAHATHLQSVLTLPAAATLLASSAHDPHQCFRIGKSAWGVQFHPEFTAQVMRTYVLEREAALCGEGLTPEELLSAVEETPEATLILRNFARIIGMAPGCT